MSEGIELGLALKRVVITLEQKRFMTSLRLVSGPYAIHGYRQGKNAIRIDVAIGKETEVEMTEDEWLDCKGDMEIELEAARD